MAILMYFHQSQYRNFKAFYPLHLCRYCRGKFPNRLIPVCGADSHRPDADVHLSAHPPGRGHGDRLATALVVCHNRRIHRRKVFKTVARRRTTPMGGLYGFKLHRVVNDRGELLAFRPTSGNVDGRKPAPERTQGLTGKLIGDCGHISHRLVHELWEPSLQLITKIRKNMPNKLMPIVDKRLLRKRAIIETINDPIKNIRQIEHTGHRSVVNARVSVLAALVAYTHQPGKPSLNLPKNENNLLIFKY